MLTGITIDGAVVEAGSFISYLVGGIVILKIMLPFILMFFIYKLLFGKSSEEKLKDKLARKNSKTKTELMKKYKSKRRY